MSQLIHNKPDLSKLPGGYEPESTPTIRGNHWMSKMQIINDKRGMAFVIKNALELDSICALVDFFKGAPVNAPVSVTGYMDGDSTAKYGGLAGSVRTTMWADNLSAQLWEIIKPMFSVRHMLDTTATDWWQGGKHRNWMPVGLTPMMRFMRYEKSGEHYAHYDAGYLYPDDTHRTLMSYVVYLTTNYTGGTRFIKDGQDNTPVWDRVHNDWDRRAEPADVEYCNRPQMGDILVFDHRLCHDVEQFMPTGDNELRIIIRGDVVYTKMRNELTCKKDLYKSTYEGLAFKAGEKYPFVREDRMVWLIDSMGNEFAFAREQKENQYFYVLDDYFHVML